MKKNVFILLLAPFLLWSCHSVRHLKKSIGPVVPADTVSVVVADTVMREDSGAIIRENYSRIMENKIQYTTFSAKVDIDYIDPDGKKTNVNAHIRMFKDSVIWVTITGMLGIEGLRACITSDSVKILDKTKKEYTIRTLSYLQEVTALPLDLTSLQELLIGNPVFLDSTITSLNRSGNNISFLSLGEFFKNLFTIVDSDKKIVSCKLDDMDNARNRTCYLDYDGYENHEGKNFATERHISVSEAKKMDLHLDFKQYSFNETLTFPFSVPKNYTRK